MKHGIAQAGNEKAVAWAAAAGAGASEGSFADAAAFGELVFNCTAGPERSTRCRGRAENLRGKILVDVANPLDFTKGMPPSLLSSGDTDSLGEQIPARIPRPEGREDAQHGHRDVMVDPAACRRRPRRLPQRQ